MKYKITIFCEAEGFNLTDVEKEDIKEEIKEVLDVNAIDKVTSIEFENLKEDK